MPDAPVNPLRPNQKIGLAQFYNSVYAPRGFALGPHHYPIVAALEDPRIDVLVLGPPGLGKSNLLCSVYPAWELGHDPALTILSISAGEALPQGFMAATMQIIQHDKTFKEVFPSVRPEQQLGWSIQRGLFVNGHHPSDPDASYKSVGLTSKALTGLHARLHIYDDLHDKENAGTAESRQIVKDIYYNTLMGRADPRGTRRVAAGRWWAADDVYQEWIQNGDWVVMQLPAVRKGQKRLWYDVTIPRGVECVFTEKLKPEPDQDAGASYIKYRVPYGFDPTGEGFYWPESKQKRTEYRTIDRRQPRTAAVNYRGDMTGGGKGVFKAEDFRVFAAPEGLADGIKSPMVHAWVTASKGAIEEAWDTALGQPQSESKTAALTGLLVPCTQWHRGEDADIVGPCDFHYDVYLIDLMVADLAFGELSKALRTRFGKWLPRRVNVEEKQSGVSLIQTFRGTHIPVRGIKVQQGKLERAVSAVIAGDDGRPIPGGAASCQGWQQMGRILVPGGAEWLTVGPDGREESGFMSRICSFSGGTKYTDEFDTLVHLVTRAIMLSGRTARFGSVDNTGPSDEEIAIANSDDPRREMLRALGMAPAIAAISENPLRGMCIAPCSHYGIVENKEWCGLRGVATNGLGGCAEWTNQKVAA